MLLDCQIGTTVSPLQERTLALDVSMKIPLGQRFLEELVAQESAVYRQRAVNGQKSFFKIYKIAQSWSVLAFDIPH